MTGKFQVTVPKGARKLLKLEKGDRLVFSSEERKIVVRKGYVKTEE